MFGTKFRQSESEQELQRYLKEWVPQWLAQERELRHQILKQDEPVKRDLDNLRTFHSQVAKEISGVIERYGWPGLSILEWSEAESVVKLVRYCWSEIPFMRSCLAVMEQAARFGEIPLLWFAKQYDMIMFLEGKPQIAGTVFEWSDQGELAIWKTVAPEELEKRRWIFQTESIEDTAKKLKGFQQKHGLRAPRDVQKYREAFAQWLKR